MHAANGEVASDHHPLWIDIDLSCGISFTVFLAVIAAAAMHASWNALVKVRTDRFASISITALGMALVAVPVLPFVDVPHAAVWPWIVASVIIHVGYRLFLIMAYNAGDLAQTYPLARGAAPPGDGSGRDLSSFTRFPAPSQSWGYCCCPGARC